jgi:hypothetical protein
MNNGFPHDKCSLKNKNTNRYTLPDNCCYGMNVNAMKSTAMLLSGMKAGCLILNIITRESQWNIVTK